MDNRGSTLIENVIAMFLLVLFAAMASSCILAGAKAVKNASLEQQRLYHVYSQIESGQHGGEVVAKNNQYLGFEFDNQDYTIEGTVYYDKDKSILGEFVREP